MSTPTTVLIAEDEHLAADALADWVRATPGLQLVAVCEDGEEALAIARRAYKQWHNSFMKLWRDHNMPPIGVAYPPEIDGFIENGMAAVGTVRHVRDLLQAQLEESGANYLGCRFAFGDLTFAESARTVDLFVCEVMPHLRAQVRVAAE